MKSFRTNGRFILFAWDGHVPEIPWFLSPRAIQSWMSVAMRRTREAIRVGYDGLKHPCFSGRYSSGVVSGFQHFWISLIKFSWLGPGPWGIWSSGCREMISCSSAMSHTRCCPSSRTSMLHQPVIKWWCNLIIHDTRLIDLTTARTVHLADVKWLIIRIKCPLRGSNLVHLAVPKCEEVPLSVSKDGCWPRWFMVKHHSSKC